MLYLKNRRKKIKGKRRKYSLNPKKLPALLLTAITEFGTASLSTLFGDHQKIKEYYSTFENQHKELLVKKKISTYLWNLKKQNLVYLKDGKWFATNLGKSLVETIKQKRFISIDTLILPPKDDVSRLVIFDIPETERQKRDWIRIELVSCDYKPLQKSVWLGFRPLPQEFIEELDFLKIKNYVHIFSIDKKGTILS